MSHIYGWEILGDPASTVSIRHKALCRPAIFKFIFDVQNYTHVLTVTFLRRTRAPSQLSKVLHEVVLVLFCRTMKLVSDFARFGGLISRLFE